jgi:hypothetical protein
MGSLELTKQGHAEGICHEKTSLVLILGCFVLAGTKIYVLNLDCDFYSPAFCSLDLDKETVNIG